MNNDALNPPLAGFTKKTVPPPGPVSPTAQVPPWAHVSATAPTGDTSDWVTTKGTDTTRALTRVAMIRRMWAH